MNKTQALDVVVTHLRTDAALINDTPHMRRTTWVVSEAAAGRAVLGDSDTTPAETPLNPIMAAAWMHFSYADAAMLNAAAQD